MKYYVNVENLIMSETPLPHEEGLVEVFPVAKIEYESIMQHIHTKLKEVELKTGFVTVLQFAVHPQGIAMILRAYSTKLEKEYSIPDAVFLSEVQSNGNEIKRINVLFDEIHKALNSIQIIKDGAFKTH